MRRDVAAFRRRNAGRVWPRRGVCVLSLAAAGGQGAIVRRLLAAGASAGLTSPDAGCARKDAAGHTPLHAAVRGGDVDAVQALLDAGANVLAEDSWGWTVLARAHQGKDAAIIAAVRAGVPAAASAAPAAPPPAAAAAAVFLPPTTPP